MNIFIRFTQYLGVAAIAMAMLPLSAAGSPVFQPEIIYDHRSDMELKHDGVLKRAHPRDNPDIEARGTDGGQNWLQVEPAVAVRDSNGIRVVDSEGGENGDAFGSGGDIDGNWLAITASQETPPGVTPLTNTDLSNPPTSVENNMRDPEDVDMGAVYIYQRKPGNAKDKDTANRKDQWVFAQKLSGAEAVFVDPILPLTLANASGPFLADKHGIPHRWGMSRVSTFFFESGANPGDPPSLEFRDVRARSSAGALRIYGDEMFVAVSNQYSQASAFTSPDGAITTSFNAIYVYKLKGNKWEFSQMITEPYPSNYDGGEFGHVSVDGKYMTISSPRQDVAPDNTIDEFSHPLYAPTGGDIGTVGEDVGGISLWKRDNQGVWRVIQKRVSSPVGDLRLNAFGFAELQNGRALITEQGGDSGRFAAGHSRFNGRVYDYRLVNEQLVYTGVELDPLAVPGTPILIGPHTPFASTTGTIGNNYGFGSSVEIAGDYIAVSQPASSLFGQTGRAGIVIIYKRDGNNIVYQQTITPNDPAGTHPHSFSSIEMKGDFLLVGSGARDFGFQTDDRNGRVYVYQRDGNGMYQSIGQVFHPHMQLNDGFGIVFVNHNTNGLEFMVGTSAPGGNNRQAARGTGFPNELTDAKRRNQSGSAVIFKLEN